MRLAERVPAEYVSCRERAAVGEHWRGVGDLLELLSCGKYDRVRAHVHHQVRVVLRVLAVGFCRRRVTEAPAHRPNGGDARQADFSNRVRTHAALQHRQRAVLSMARACYHHLAASGPLGRARVRAHAHLAQRRHVENRVTHEEREFGVGSLARCAGATAKQLLQFSLLVVGEQLAAPQVAALIFARIPRRPCRAGRARELLAPRAL
mmetsp:Transcript_11259/g.46996  ORF Transcript_11259/g.46996 Transcript_11259/m.46996 type:complete len:207 (-) Transcript_11259:1434-2054(-)